MTRKQMIGRTVFTILMIPLAAVVMEGLAAYLGVYHSPYPWPIGFKIGAIISAVVGSLLYELINMEHKASNKDKIKTVSTRNHTKYTASMILKIIAGLALILIAVVLFVRFAIVVVSVYNTNPDAVIPTKEMMLGTLVPLILGITGGSFLASLSDNTNVKKS